MTIREMIDLEMNGFPLVKNLETIVDTNDNDYMLVITFATVITAENANSRAIRFDKMCGRLKTDLLNGMLETNLPILIKYLEEYQYGGYRESEYLIKDGMRVLYWKGCCSKAIKEIIPLTDDNHNNCPYSIPTSAYSKLPREMEVQFKELHYDLEAWYHSMAPLLYNELSLPSPSLVLTGTWKAKDNAPSDNVVVIRRDSAIRISMDITLPWYERVLELHEGWTM